MRTASILLLGLCASAFLLAGCRSTNANLLSYELQMKAGRYDGAASTMVREADRGNGDQLLWRLLAGNAYMASGASESAVSQLDLAEDVFLANDGASAVSCGARQARGMLTNDLAFPYQGYGQDRIFCCLYKALEYSAMGNFAATRTELNRAAEHQENWLFERRRALSAAEEELSRELSEVPEEERVEGLDAGQSAQRVLSDGDFLSTVKAELSYDPEAVDLSRLAAADYANAYLAHFCGVFRWIQGDGGRDYLRDAAGLRPDNPVVKRDFQESDKGMRPRDQVWIYVEDGLCPDRVERRIDLPLILLPGIGGYAPYAGMAFPLLRENAPAAVYSVVCQEQKRLPMSLLQDVDRLIRTEYNVYMKGALPREIARATTKVAAQVALGIVANSSRDNYSAMMAARAAQAAAAAWAISTTAADLRSWITLPKYVWMQRVDRPADGKLAVLAENAGVQEILHLDLPQGNTIVWIRKFTPGTTMVAKVITY